MPRGRPKLSAYVVAKDEIIARTVQQLLVWGYVEGQVCKPVGVAAAASPLHRTAPSGAPLTGYAVEKIWKRHQPAGWERYWPTDMRAAAKPVSVLRIWARESRRAVAPAGTIRDLAALLLTNGGEPPFEHVSRAGGLQPSAAWESDMRAIPAQRKWGRKIRR